MARKAKPKAPRLGAKPSTELVDPHGHVIGYQKPLTVGEKIRLHLGWALGWASKKSSDGNIPPNSRRGVGGGPGPDDFQTPTHPRSTRWHEWDVTPTPYNPNQRPDTASAGIDPGSVIGRGAMQHANQPVWEHTYGQSV
jgi:hypothetical protein